MNHCLLELVKNLDTKTKIGLKESIMLLQDKKWHDIYEIHNKYRLSPAVIVDCLNFLSSIEVIKIEGSRLAFVEDINNSKVAVLNYLMKNETPSILKVSNIES